MPLRDVTAVEGQRSTIFSSRDQSSGGDWRNSRSTNGDTARFLGGPQKVARCIRTT